MAIDDPEEAAASPIGRVLLDMLPGEALRAYAVFVDDLHAHAERLGLKLHTVRRGGLEAYVAGAPEALREPFLPFFIGSNDRGPRPGDAGDAGGLTWIEVAGDQQRLATGSAAPSCRSAWSRASPRCARSGSATASSVPASGRGSSPSRGSCRRSVRTVIAAVSGPRRRARSSERRFAPLGRSVTGAP